MSHQSGSPFVPVPVNFPWFGREPDAGPAPPQLGNEVPARIRTAIEFLQFLAVKQQARAAVNDISIEVIPGQRLIGPETEAQVAACDLLTSFFKGRHKDNDWERRFLINADAEPPTPVGTLLNCFKCHHFDKPRPDCELCRGAGVLTIFAGEVNRR